MLQLQTVITLKRWSLVVAQGIAPHFFSFKDTADKNCTFCGYASKLITDKRQIVVVIHTVNKRKTVQAVTHEKQLKAVK